MNRRNAREIALCLIFDFGFNTEEKPEELLELYLEYFQVDENKDKDISEKIRNDAFISKVYFGVSEKLGELDEIISKHSANWKLERVSRVSLSILRLALYEMRYMDDIPTEVSINEAVELAKKYDHDDGYTFINGILGAAEKQMRDE